MGDVLLGGLLFMVLLFLVGSTIGFWALVYDRGRKAQQ